MRRLQSPEEASDAWRDYVCGELRTMGERLTQLEGHITATKKSTEDLLGMFEACRGGFKVIGWMGKFVVWIGGILVGVTGIVTFWHTVSDWWKGE